MSLVTIKHLPQKALRNISCIYDDKELKEGVLSYIKNNELIRVADIELNDEVQNPLEEAFRLTNSINCPWYLNENISVSDYAKGGCRSTSIGDIIMVNGRIFIVASFGFLEL